MRVFVLNCGRSGSKAVARAFNLLHEPDGTHPDPQKALQRADGRKLYGETSTAWRWKIKELKEAFPDALYIHLIRDGRDVVSSYMCRKRYTYLPNDDGGFQRNIPIPDVDNFEDLSRFEKVCHFWRYWNQVFEKERNTVVRLEDIQHSFPKVNQSDGKGENDPSNWTDEQNEQFNRICGPLMRKYYPESFL